MGPILGAAAISSLGSVASGLYSGLFSAGSQRRQYKYNLSLQRQQQEWQKRMWELQNEFNLPVNEVQRLLDAGINPALAFNNAGAAAAPVPQSGSAGGVSAPTASMPNAGASAVMAAQAQQRLDNETKIADSTAEKNNAEADAARESAGLTATRNRYEDVLADAAEKNRPVYVLLPRLDAASKVFDAHLKGNDVKRSDIYTNSFEERNSLELARMRLDNHVLRADYNRIVHLTELYKAQGRLTDAQAANVRLQNDLLFVERYYARWNYQMARIINAAVYGDADSPDPNSRAMSNLILAAQNEAANALARSAVNQKSLFNDFQFEDQYGLGARFYSGYEGPRRQANKTRVDQYTGVVNTFTGIGMAVVSAGASRSLMRYRDAATKALNRTSREFGVDPVSPSYLGGPEYYPFGDF